MAQTLYRKYRPQRFADLVGQRHIRVTLMHEITSGQLAHAYVFTGPRGVGKTTVARLLARAINCEHPVEAEPDNTCKNCTQMLGGQALDLLEIDAASQTGVDNVRENIIANARVAPAQFKYKVFIIDEVHMLSIGAFNALLKLLEEPPQHALFVLATTEVHKVPETILSRCQRFDFHRVAVDDLKKRLATLAQAEGVQVHETVLEDLARRAEGSVRDADSLLGQLLALGEKEITEDVAAIALPRTNVASVLEFFQCFVTRQRGTALTVLNTLVEEGVSLPHFLHRFVELVRGLLLLKLNPTIDRGSLVVLDAKQEQEVLAVLPSFSVDELVTILEAFRELEGQVRNASIPQLPIELAIVKAIPASVPSDASVAVPRAKLAPAAVKPPAAKRSAVKAEVPKKKSKTESVDLATVVTAWPKIIAAAREGNHGVALLLKSAVPANVEDGTLLLGVRFPFHAERIMEHKNRDVVERALEQVLGAKLTVKCAVGKADGAPDAVAEDIAAAFGGEVL